MKTLNKKLFALSLTIFTLLSMFSFLPLVQAYTEPDPNTVKNILWYDCLSSLYVKMYYWDGDSYEYFATRYFAFTNDTHPWYSKELMWNYGTTFDAVLKPNSKYYNNTGYSNIYGYSLVVGFEDSDNQNEGFDDIVICVDANRAHDDVVNWYLLFVDTLYCSSSYKLEVWNSDINKKIHDYPNGFTDSKSRWHDGKQQCAQDLDEYGTFEDAFTPDYIDGGGPYGACGDSSDTGHWDNITYDAKSIYTTAMRLRAKQYYGSSGDWTYDITRGVMQKGNTAKWWFKIFRDISYTAINNSTLTRTIYKLMIGYEDGGGTNAPHDNFVDLVFAIVHIYDFHHPIQGQPDTYWWHLEKKLDFIQCSGGYRKEVYWENNYFESGSYTSKFGTSDYEHYKYGIALETVEW
jgi:hypothetical protein